MGELLGESVAVLIAEAFVAALAIATLLLVSRAEE